MAKSFAKQFYHSQAWQSCREAYLKKQCYLCERCGAPATIVHHKRRVTPETIQDPEVLLNFKNLEALCYACHQKEHEAERKAGLSKDKEPPRYIVDANGKVFSR